MSTSTSTGQEDEQEDEDADDRGVINEEGETPRRRVTHVDEPVTEAVGDEDRDDDRLMELVGLQRTK
jgi:hypothetical protein